jgi:hypothetical protein
VCVCAFGGNLASVAVKMLSYLTYFIDFMLYVFSVRFLEVAGALYCVALQDRVSVRLNVVLRSPVVFIFLPVNRAVSL